MQSRFLLRPGPRAKAIIKGVIGRAQERYRMAICAIVWLGNHWHALLLPENSRQLSSFMRYVNSVAEASASELSLAVRAAKPAWPCGATSQGSWGGSTTGESDSGLAAFRRSLSATRTRLRSGASSTS